jgi:hypothetical protein
MQEAGFRSVFLGIENILEEDLRFLRAESKNRERENGRNSGNATLKAIEHLHRNKMIVVGGLIVGSPGNTASRSKPILNSPENMWTGLTSSTRRPTQARR